MQNEQLRKAGLKVTLPRVKVLALLEGSDKRHVTAEDVYRMLLENGEKIGLATIYRVLTQFESVGLVCRHNFESGQSIFEVDCGRHHDHLICVKCGKIVEFIDEIVEKRQTAVAKWHGFTIQDHSLVIYGVCDNPECQE